MILLCRCLVGASGALSPTSVTLVPRKEPNKKFWELEIISITLCNINIAKINMMMKH